MDLFLDENLNAFALVLDDAVPAIASEGPEVSLNTAVEADVYFIFSDEPESEPTFLAKIAAGSTARVPFPTTNRAITLFAVPRGAKGEQSTTDFAKVETTTFDFPK
jgi:hypothetical protein